MNRSSPFLRTTILLAVAAAIATAARGQSVIGLPRGEALQNLERVPVHRGADGVEWAAGRDYKARFDQRGMTFFPALGEAAPANLPLGWTTREIRFEEGPVLVAAGAIASSSGSTEFVHELHYGAVTERYLVQADGLEQQFAIPRPLEFDDAIAASSGDLIVRGRIDGPLTAVDREPTVGPVEFRSADGRPIVTYGAALVIDAAGDRHPVPTAIRGSEIELRVGASWLREARWPLLIDPLTSRHGTLAGATPASLPSVARDLVSDRVLVSYSRASAGTDWDLFVSVLNANFASGTSLYSDLTTDSVRASSAGFAATANRWIVAMEVQNAASWRLRVLFHDAADTTFGSGLTVNVQNLAGRHLSSPSLGVSRTSSTACMIALQDLDPAGPNDTPNSEVVNLIVNPASRSVGSTILVGHVAGANLDAARPQISPVSDVGGWVVVWQEWNPTGTGAWDVIGRRLASTGVPTGSRSLLLGGNDQELTPVVAGGSSRWVLAAVRRDRGAGTKISSTTGNRIVSRRFDWAENAASPTTQSVYEVESTPGDSIQLGLARRPIAFDDRTLSHWTVAWQRDDLKSLRITRIGFDGLRTETTDLEPPPPLGATFRSPTLVLDEDNDGVIAAYASDGYSFGEPIYARRFTVDPSAAVFTLGTGCAGVPRAGNGLLTDRPWRGSEFFGVALDSGVPTAPTWLLAAALPGSQPLPEGAPGCLLLLDPATLLPVIGNGMTDGAGYWATQLALPSSLAAMTIYWQFVQFDGGLLRASSSLRTDIR